jgi:hypothetical protein
MESMIVNQGDEVRRAWRWRERWHGLTGNREARDEARAWAEAGFDPAGARAWRVAGGFHLETSTSPPEPVEAAAWRGAGFDPFMAGWFRHIGLEPSEARIWVDALSPVLPAHRDVNLEVRAWADQGFSPTDAVGWASELARWSPSPMESPSGSERGWVPAHAARQYADQGMTAGEAGTWQRALGEAIGAPLWETLATQSAGWLEAGFTPEEAATWITTTTVPRLDAIYSDWIGPGGEESERHYAAGYLSGIAARWREIGMSPHDAAVYYSAGYSGPGEVLADEAQARVLAEDDLQRRRAALDEVLSPIGEGEPETDDLDVAAGSADGLPADDDFDLWRDVIGDDIVCGGVVYGSQEWRRTPDGDVERIPQWEQDRAQYYRVLEGRGGDVEATLQAELENPRRDWRAAIKDLLGTDEAVSRPVGGCDDLLSQLPALEAPEESGPRAQAVEPVDPPVGIGPVADPF